MADLIERLRANSVENGGGASWELHKAAREAADRIAALEAALAEAREYVDLQAIKSKALEIWEPAEAADNLLARIDTLLGRKI